MGHQDFRCLDGQDVVGLLSGLTDISSLMLSTEPSAAQTFNVRGCRRSDGCTWLAFDRVSDGEDGRAWSLVLAVLGAEDSGDGLLATRA